MVTKFVFSLALAAAAALFVRSLPELARYLKMREM